MKHSFSDDGKFKKIAMITAYDSPTAKMAIEASADILLVGDSLGTNTLGYDTVREVTVADICHHTAAVRRGAPEAFILSDIPWKAMETPGNCLAAAQRILNSGANAIKIEVEAGREAFLDILAENNIEVCSHVGYTPQTPGLPVTVQGKNLARAIEIVQLAQLSEEHGASMIVLELIPAELADLITDLLTIPTIGIGAGPFCNGQVQVYYDIAGFSDKTFRHAKLYRNAGEELATAFKEYVDEVHDGFFPRMNNCTSISKDLIREIKETLNLDMIDV